MALVRRPLDQRPVIGITLGDPMGIGPEIILRALAEPEIRRLGRFTIYGINTQLTHDAERAAIEPFWYRVPAESPRAMEPMTEPVVVLDHTGFDLPAWGERSSSRIGGLASKAFVESAITDLQRDADHPRHLDAVVTAPISKTSWQMAGYAWPGHTELFAHRFRAQPSAMMFVSPKLRVVLATAHIPLLEIREALTIGRIFDPIDLGHRACMELGIARPRIAVCGLNPHAGEGGRFGDEEARLISPAIELAQRAGIDARGPFPADTIFIAAARGAFDLVVAMYHDQGLIPVKLLGWEDAVNWTIGLPVIRTSPDHGTAFDIAGTGQARAGSMVAAIRLACDLASQRRIRTSGGRTQA
ncbi:MAG: 4-hydroxythreonine-4-phosphate dehydrogenase PdxA [Phycisphaeraceae bacterium]|nr:4-hydroxythreonine-4-phosphate dehydrogenase PdxA [Phycisphaeraceae bacterium]